MAAVASTSSQPIQDDTPEQLVAEEAANPLDNLPPLAELIKRSVERTRTLFHSPGVADPELNTAATRVKIAAKLSSEYRDSQTLPAALLAQQSGASGPARPGAVPGPAASGRKMITSGGNEALVDEVAAKQRSVFLALIWSTCADDQSRIQLCSHSARCTKAANITVAIINKEKRGSTSQTRLSSSMETT